MKTAVCIALLAFCLQLSGSLAYRRHHYRDGEEKTNGQVLKECQAKGIGMLKEAYKKMKEGSMTESEKRDSADALQDYLDEAVKPEGPSMEHCKKLVLELLKVIYGPEAKPTTKAPTQAPADYLDEIMEEDEEVKPSAKPASGGELEACKNLAIKKLTELGKRVRAFLNAKARSPAEKRDAVMYAVQDTFNDEVEGGVTIAKCIKDGETVVYEELVALFKQVYAILAGKKPTTAPPSKPATTPLVEDFMF